MPQEPLPLPPDRSSAALPTRVRGRGPAGSADRPHPAASLPEFHRVVPTQRPRRGSGPKRLDRPHPGSVRTRSPARAEPPAGCRPDAGRHDSPRRWSDPELQGDPTSAPRRVTDEAGRAEPTPGSGRHEAGRSHQVAAGGHGPIPDGRAARRSDRLAGQAEPGRFAAETRAAETGAFRGNGGVESWSEGGWRPGRAA